MDREVGLGLIPYTVLPSSLVNRAVSVDVNTMERKKENMACEYFS